MFGKRNMNKSFKGDRDLNKFEISFLEELTSKLSFRYPSFKLQLESKVIVQISVNPLGKKGSFSFTVDSERWNVLSYKARGSFKILGAVAYDDSGNRAKIEISTNEGLMTGFYCSKELNLIKPSTIDITDVYEKHFLNQDLEEISEIVQELRPYLRKLNIANTFKIKLDDDYYTIKDLEDGNYIVVNRQGQVFELIHDPFEVKKIFNSVEAYVKNL